jgi:hypothetical protein
MGKPELVRPVREALVKHRLLDCDYEWAQGRKSLGYRIGPALQDVGWHRYTSPNKRFTKRVQKFKAHFFSDSVVIPLRQHLIDWCKKVEFSDQLEEVLLTLPEIPYEDSEFSNKRQMAAHQVEMIKGGYLSFTPSCAYGRFHSNFTSLCSELRRCLLINGEPLVEIDIVNSQPYFLSMILFETCLSRVGVSKVGGKFRTKEVADAIDGFHGRPRRDVPPCTRPIPI